MIRKLTRILAALVALAFGAIATILIAAHWQIRQIEPPLPTAQAIELALAAEDTAAAISYINTATQSGPFGTLGHVGVFIEWEDDSAAFLIDTGHAAGTGHRLWRTPGAIPGRGSHPDFRCH